jgi:hypothetical protein
MYFSNSKELFKTDTLTLELEKTENLVFKESITLYPEFLEMNGLGRIMLINRDDNIPLLLSFQRNEGTLELTLSHFDKGNWFDDKQVFNIPLFKSLSIVRTTNEMLSIMIDNINLTVFISKIPINIAKIKVFNSFGEFFGSTTKVVIK